MTKTLVLDAISFLDANIIAEHLKMKQSLTAAPKKKKPLWLKCSALAAAVAIICLGAIAIQMIPVRLDVDYSTVQNSGKENACGSDVRWIYYVQNSKIKKKAVYIPTCIPETVFLAWKELNGIGNDVEMIEYKLSDNAKMANFYVNGVELKGIEFGSADTIIMDVTISKSIKNYASGENFDKLIQSLEKTLMSKISKDLKQVSFHVHYQ